MNPRSDSPDAKDPAQLYAARASGAAVTFAFALLFAYIFAPAVWLPVAVVAAAFWWIWLRKSNAAEDRGRADGSDSGPAGA